MNTNTQLESLKSKIRPRLVDFLREEGVEVSENGMLRCIHPMHQDNTASMKILADLNSEELYCYGCEAKGDIFTAHHWLKDAPMQGYAFIKENLYALADQFNIEYEEIELTPEQLEKLDRLRINKIAASLLVAQNEEKENVNHDPSFALERGWKPEVCKELQISTIVDYRRFLLALSSSSGYDPEELREKYDIRGDLFGPAYITIPLYDVQGQCIGFTARWLKWQRGAKQGKYSNSVTSSVFNKSRHLYGLHKCRNTNGRIDIFEGNGSFISAYGEGHQSCVALCSSSISEQQISILQDFGYTHFNICLDGDDTGRKKTAQFMETLSGREGLKVTCTWIPEGLDPDDLIQNEGLEGFSKLKTQSAFSHFLEKEVEEAKKGDTSRFVNKMIKVIQNTENRVERGQQIQELSEALGVPEEDLRDEMKRLERVSVDSIRGKIAHGIRNARDTDELLAVMEQTRVNIENTAGSRSERVNLSANESLENFDNLVTVLKNREPGLQGWSSGYKILDHKLSGIPKPVGKDDDGNPIPIPGALIGFAGASQHGKSTVLQNLVLGLATNNEDITLLYWALDDARERVLERMIAMHSGVRWGVVTKRISPTPEEEVAINQSVEVFRQLIAEGRFVLKDQSNGRTIPMVTRWVEQMQKDHDRPVCLVIDSFHKISASGDELQGSEVAKAKAHSEALKSLYKTHKLTIMCSLEINKAAGRGTEPDMLTITESRKIEYDFDIIAMVFNHYFDMDGQSDMIIVDGIKTKPLIKVNFRKSKDGGGGPVYFALDQSNFQTAIYTIDEVKSMTGTQEVNTKEIAGSSLVPPDKGNLVKVSKNDIEPWLN